MPRCLEEVSEAWLAPRKSSLAGGKGSINGWMPLGNLQAGTSPTSVATATSFACGKGSINGWMPLGKMRVGAFSASVVVTTASLAGGNG